MDASDQLEETLSVILRPYDPELDQACIYATWRNSAYHSAVTPIELPQDFWFRSFTQKIKNVLKHATIQIACLEDSPTVIVGYAVYSGAHLDWIYVKVDYRERGIGTLLFPKHIETVTRDLTKIGDKIVQKKNLKHKGESDHGHQS